MAGALVVLGLIALVLWIFVALFRRRVRSRLQSAGHDLPPELTAALRERGQAARPGAGVTPAAAVGRLAAVPRTGASVAVAPATVAPAAAGRLPAGGGLHYLLIYDVGPDFLQRRAQYRDQHLALAWKAAAAGELLLAGALEEPTEQAFLLFRGSREAARRFAESDPYVMHGLVRQWRIKQWHTVAGEAAALPLRPGAKA